MGSWSEWQVIPVIANPTARRLVIPAPAFRLWFPAFTAAAQKGQRSTVRTQHHFGRVLVLPALVLPFAGFKLAFDIDLGAFAQVLLGDFGQRLREDRNRVPFGTLAALGRDGREPLSLGDVAGLSGRRPLVAAALTAVLISLTGVPVSAGFVGKFFLFRAAVDAGWASLAILGVLMSVVSAYYYLRVVVSMYMRPAEGADVWGRVGPVPGAALLICAATVLGLGVYPGPLLELARAAGAVFR